MCCRLIFSCLNCQVTLQALLNAWHLDIYQCTIVNCAKLSNSTDNGLEIWKEKTLWVLWVFPACNTEAKQALWAYAGNLHKHPEGFFNFFLFLSYNIWSCSGKMLHYIQIILTQLYFLMVQQQLIQLLPFNTTLNTNFWYSLYI